MKFSTVLFSLVGLSVAIVNHDFDEGGLVEQRIAAAVPATAERIAQDRAYGQQLLEDQKTYDEKRRIDYLQHEKAKLDELEADVKARADWDKRARDAAAVGIQAVRDVARQRAEFEARLAFDKYQREQAWESRRDHEEREFEDRRQVKIDEWKAKDRELRAREAREYAERARKAWETYIGRAQPALAAAAAPPAPAPTAAPPAPAA